MYDDVTKPEHYQFNKPCNEVRDVINDRISKFLETNYYNADQVYNFSNLIKYTLRWPFKENPIKDLKKARECIEELLKVLEDKPVPVSTPIPSIPPIPTKINNDDKYRSLPKANFPPFD